MADIATVTINGVTYSLSDDAARENLQELTNDFNELGLSVADGKLNITYETE